MKPEGSWILPREMIQPSVMLSSEIVPGGGVFHMASSMVWIASGSGIWTHSGQDPGRIPYTAGDVDAYRLGPRKWLHVIRIQKRNPELVPQPVVRHNNRTQVRVPSHSNWRSDDGR